MRIAVLSSTTFGWRCVREGILPCPPANLVGILTTPHSISISYSSVPVEIHSHTDFTQTAAESGCEVAVQHGPIRTADYLSHLERWRPDLILALGWYYNIPAEVRSVAATGCLGIHASLLPKYRGGAPIPWAIINGERETGVTLFHLEDEVDSGDIIAQTRIPIHDDDISATVYERAEIASVEILKNYLPRLAAGTAPRVPQDHSKATVFPQRSPADGLIDWSWDNDRIKNFIRAQTRPYPGAFFYVGGKKIILWDASVVDQDEVAFPAAPTPLHRSA